MLETHIEQTRQHAQNLEQTFSQMRQEPQRVESPAAQGLVAEGQMKLQEAQGAPDALRDCVIGRLSQAKVEALEIATYKALVTSADQMGQQEASELLNQNLEQEKQAAQMIEQNAPQLEQRALQTA